MSKTRKFLNKYTPVAVLLVLIYLVAVNVLKPLDFNSAFGEEYSYQYSNVGLGVDQLQLLQFLLISASIILTIILISPVKSGALKSATLIILASALISSKMYSIGLTIFPLIQVSLIGWLLVKSKLTSRILTLTGVLGATVVFTFYHPYQIEIYPTWVLDSLKAYSFDGILTVSLALVTICSLFILKPTTIKVVISILLITSAFLFQHASVLVVLAFSIQFCSLKNIETDNIKKLLIGSMYVILPISMALLIFNYDTNLIGERGLPTETEKIMKVLHRNSISGNVFCLPSDKNEAKLLFGLESNVKSSEFESEFVTTNLGWASHRTQEEINIIFFNLKNRSTDELVFLGNRLGETEWAMIYHTPEKKAILLRRESKFSDLIQKFEIQPEL